MTRAATTPGESRRCAEQLAAQRGGDDQGRHRAAPQAGDHGCEALGPELPVPVEFAVHRKLQARDVHDDADEGDQDQREHVGDLPRHRRPVHVREVGWCPNRPQAFLDRAREQQAGGSRLFAGYVEGEESEMARADEEHDADRQDQRMTPAPHRQVKGEPVGRTRRPLPQHVGIEEPRYLRPVRIDPHHGERRDTNGAADSGDEPTRDRVGNEAHHVGETKLADDEAERAGGDRSDDQRDRSGDEQRVTFGSHGGADERHPDHECRRKAGDRAAKAACERDEQTGGEVAEQHQADALRRIGSQRSREDEGSEGDLGGKQPQA